MLYTDGARSNASRAVFVRFGDAATAFEKFKGKLLVCAGNHDLGWWGSIEKYREFCKYLDLPGDCSVASQLKKKNNSTTIDLLGLDSTWWCPGLGIAGVGRIDDDELAAAKAFADKSSKGWKLLCKARVGKLQS